ncbi:tetratricopeptide repeat protein [Streptomyces sp. NPDC005133]
MAKDLSESGSHSAQYASAARVLSTAAEALGDLRTTGRAALILAEAEQYLGQFDAAEEGADRALREATVSRDTPVLCRASNLRGVVALYRNRHDDAETHLTHALEAFRADGDRPGEAGVLCNLSRVRLTQGDTSTALSLAEQAVAIYDQIGLSVRGANAHYTLGLALTQAGRLDEASAVLYKARDIFRSHRQRLWGGMTFFRLAEADLAARRPRQAAAHAEQALTHIGVSGGQWRRGNILTVLGRALHAMDQTDRARICWQEALTIFEDLDSAESQEVRDLLGDTVTSSSRKPG